MNEVTVLVCAGCGKKLGPYTSDNLWDSWENHSKDCIEQNGINFEDGTGKELGNVVPRKKRALEDFGYEPFKTFWQSFQPDRFKPKQKRKRKVKAQKGAKQLNNF